jgi:hypothetical protein
LRRRASTDSRCGAAETFARDQLPGAAESLRQARATAGVLCEISDYLACSEDAQRAFDRRVLACIGGAIATGSAFGPQAAAGSLFACTVSAVAEWVLKENSCKDDATCTASQLCLNWQCTDPTITVTSATYGGNCGAPSGNATGYVAGQCNGELGCSVFVGNSVLGDPVFGCPKDFVVEYSCSGLGARSVSHGPVVNENYTVTLTCQ